MYLFIPCLSLKILVSSILPRLDEADQFIGVCTLMMKKCCAEFGAVFLDMEESFPREHRRLWSRKDSVHLSEDAGLPRFIRILQEHIDKEVVNSGFDKDTANGEPPYGVLLLQSRDNK